MVKRYVVKGDAVVKLLLHSCLICVALIPREATAGLLTGGVSIERCRGARAVLAGHSHHDHILDLLTRPRSGSWHDRQRTHHTGDSRPIARTHLGRVHAFAQYPVPFVFHFLPGATIQAHFEGSEIGRRRLQ